MTADNEQKAFPTGLTVNTPVAPLDALRSASLLYERYVNIVELAHLAAFHQDEVVPKITKAPPLGLVIWPQK